MRLIFSLHKVRVIGSLTLLCRPHLWPRNDAGTPIYLDYFIVTTNGHVPSRWRHVHAAKALLRRILHSLLRQPTRDRQGATQINRLRLPYLLCLIAALCGQGAWKAGQPSRVLVRLLLSSVGQTPRRRNTCMGTVIPVHSMKKRSSSTKPQHPSWEHFVGPLNHCLRLPQQPSQPQHDVCSSIVVQVSRRIQKRISE